MPILDIAALRAALPPGSRLLGLDVGTKTVGLAVSDISLTVATPVEVVRRSRFARDAARIEAVMDDRGAGGLILGLPVNMDGSEGPRCQSLRQFAANLLARRDAPTAFWDERLSTAAVERMLVREADLSRKRRREVIDKLAAVYILQGALDAMAARP